MIIYLRYLCGASSFRPYGAGRGQRGHLFPGFENELTGAVETDLSVVTDGKMITGKGPGVAVDFALENRGPALRPGGIQ